MASNPLNCRRFSDQLQPRLTLGDKLKYICVHEDRKTALTRGDIKRALGHVVSKSLKVMRGVCDPILGEPTYHCSVEIMADIFPLLLLHLCSVWMRRSIYPQSNPVIFSVVKAKGSRGQRVMVYLNKVSLLYGGKSIDIFFSDSTSADLFLFLSPSAKVPPPLVLTPKQTNFSFIQ